jgi:hypothetical protein
MGEEIDSEGEFQTIRRGLVAGDGLDAGIEHHGIDPAPPEQAHDFLAGAINRAKARQISIDDDQSLSGAGQSPKLLDPRRGPCQQDDGEVRRPAQQQLESLAVDAPPPPPSSPPISG